MEQTSTAHVLLNRVPPVRETLRVLPLCGRVATIHPAIPCSTLSFWQQVWHIDLKSDVILLKYG